MSCGFVGFCFWNYSVIECGYVVVRCVEYACVEVIDHVVNCCCGYFCCCVGRCGREFVSVVFPVCFAELLSRTDRDLYGVSRDFCDNWYVVGCCERTWFQINVVEYSVIS